METQSRLSHQGRPQLIPRQLPKQSTCSTSCDSWSTWNHLPGLQQPQHLQPQGSASSMYTHGAQRSSLPRTAWAHQQTWGDSTEEGQGTLGCLLCDTPSTGWLLGFPTLLRLAANGDNQAWGRMDICELLLPGRLPSTEHLRGDQVRESSAANWGSSGKHKINK